MIKKYLDCEPVVDPTSFIAETAVLIGDVEVKADANIWYGVVIRADGDKATIGENTNIQDNAVIHVDKGVPTHIGKDVTVGHGAIVHACTIHDNVLIGMGSIILDGAVIEENVIVGAGALVPPGKVIPKNSLVVGSPAKVVRQLTEDEIKGIKDSARHYVALASEHKA